MLNSAPCRYKQRFVLRNYPLSKIMGVNTNKCGPEVIKKIVGILTFMSRKNSILCLYELEKC